MATDFSYGGRTIVTSGAIRPSEKNTPTDARCRVTTKADIANIPLPAVGLLVYVEDEGKFYVVKGLKVNEAGRENMQVDMAQVVELAGGSGSSTGGGLDENAVKSICATYHSENTVTKTLTPEDFTLGSDGIYEAVVNHNLDTQAFNIIIVDAQGSAVYECFDIVNSNNIKIYNDAAENLTVTIRK